MKSYNRTVQWIEDIGIDEEIPGLSSTVRGGYYYARERVVNPELLLDSLTEACAKTGVDLIEQCPVEDINLKSSQGVELITPDRRYRSESVLIATGAWTGVLSERLPMNVPVSPRKGQMIRVRHSSLESVPLIHAGETYLVPRSGPNLDVGATLHPDSDFDEEIVESDTRKLMNGLNQIIEGVDRQMVVNTWTGLRPYAHKKGGPFMDQFKGGNLYVCAGHYRSGITQGPISGQIMADWMTGGQPDFKLDDYRVDR